MSKPTDTPTPITVANPAPETKTEVVEKRPNIIVRGYRKARSNPKLVLATAAGVGLVAAGAVLGRSTAPSNDFPEVPDTESNDEMFEGEFVAELDTDVN